MLGEVFEFMNSCFPNQKLILKVGNLKLDEEAIKEMEARKQKQEEATDICPICLEEKPVDDLHKNCGK